MPMFIEPLLSAVLWIIIIIVVLMIFLRFVPIGLWISALAAGAKVGIFDLIGMRLRRARHVRRLLRPPARGSYR